MVAEERGVEQRVVLERMLAEIQARPDDPESVDKCRECGDTGWRMRVDERGRSLGASPCACSVPTPAARLEKLGVPRRNLECTIDSLELGGRDRSVQHAVLAARGFVSAFPLETAGKGLLLVGTCGTGKTHLATGILRSLVLERGAAGRFIDFRELFARLKRTYRPNPPEDETEVLDELFSAEVLVLDELGGPRVTEWTYDICESVIDRLYRRRGTTILTTNLPNLPAGGRVAGGGESLGDRIGHRAWSRLQEMCRVLDMNGADYRVRGGRG